MENSILLSILGLVCLSLLLLQKSDAAEFTLGWSVPNPSIHFDQWAQNNRFQIGDSIVFNYPTGQDSVLRVSQDDYTNCNTDATTAEKFSDGHSTFKFNQSGAFYFISGNKDNCVKNEKLVVIILADRSQTGTTPQSPAPAAGASPPSTPTPTPAPESDQVPPPPPPPPSSATSIFFSLIGSIGAVASYSSFLLF